MKLNVVLIHNKKKVNAVIETTSTAACIMEAAERAFNIPAAKQKIVFKGKTLTARTRLEPLNLIVDAKIMVLGVPVADPFEGYSEKLEQLSKDYSAAGVDLTKLACIGEACQQALEALDGMDIPATETEQRQDRKNYIKAIQRIQEDADKTLADLRK